MEDINMYFIAFCLLVLFIASCFILSKLRLAMTIITMCAGLVFLLNDFYANMIEETTLKLVFIICFLMYCLIIITNIVMEDSRND